MLRNSDSFSTVSAGGGLVAKSCPILVTPWAIPHQASLSMGFPRQEYWSGLQCPPLEDLPDPGTELASPALAGGFFATEPPGKPLTGMGCATCYRRGLSYRRGITLLGGRHDGLTGLSQFRHQHQQYLGA